jgi:glutaredoxin
MDRIIFYSTHCPKCNVLKVKLDDAEIDYEENNDTEEMIKKGFMTSPVLEVNGKYLDFSKALKWIKERN